MIFRVLTIGLMFALEAAVCPGLASAESLVIEADEPVVDLHVALGLNGPAGRASASGSIVSSLREGADASMDIGDYRLTVLVVKNQETEFALDLSFSDKQGEVKASRGVTVSLDRVAMFDLTIDNVIIEGVIEVVGIFGSFESYQHSFK